MKDLSIDILPDGTIRFSRKDEDYNNHIKDIIKEVCSKEDLEKSKMFFKGATYIKNLIGNDNLCG